MSQIDVTTQIAFNITEKGNNVKQKETILLFRIIELQRKMKLVESFLSLDQSTESLFAPRKAVL